MHSSQVSQVSTRSLAIIKIRVGWEGKLPANEWESLSQNLSRKQSAGTMFFYWIPVLTNPGVLEKQFLYGLKSHHGFLYEAITCDGRENYFSSLSLHSADKNWTFGTVNYSQGGKILRVALQDSEDTHVHNIAFVMDIPVLKLQSPQHLRSKTSLLTLEGKHLDTADSIANLPIASKQHTTVNVHLVNF